MTKNSSYDHELTIAQDIARASGRIMLKYFDTDQQTEFKSDGSPVTIADKQINQLVIDQLRVAFPDDGVVGEEQSTTSYGLGRKWICDPLDGTKAYTWGVPTSMFSLALIVDGQPQVGVVYDPYLDRLYTATRGNGSYCNGHKLAVSSVPLSGGLVAVSSSVALISRGLDHVKALIAAGAKPITFSGAVYKAVLVAQGRLVGYIEAGVNAYDVAAVQAIVSEAGGKVTGLDGEPLDYTVPFRGVVVSNGRTHDELLQTLDPISLS